MPGIGFGQIAAQNGPKGRRDHRKAAGHNGCHRVRPARKNHEHRCEHGRDQRTARKSLQGTKQDQFAEIAAERAGKARKRKRKRRPGEQPAQRQRAGQKSGQRNGDDFRDQIGGLYPAQPVFADTKRRTDTRQRTGHDLDIQNGHEHADAHGQKPDPVAGRYSLWPRFRIRHGACVRRGCSARSSMRMRQKSSAKFAMENTMAISTSPKASGRSAISPATSR